MKAKPIKQNQLYKIKSLKKLKKLIFFDDEKYNKNEYNVYCIKDGNRLVEEPKGHLLSLHKRIFKFLNQIELPQYVFSSVKGKSHKDNALYHINNEFVVALDISKFFPKCSSSYVYKFYKNKLCMSHDNASLLTEISTIDSSNINLDSKVLNWYNNSTKTLKYPIPPKHIPTGSCLSQKLSFLAYMDMFNEIFVLCNSHHVRMSVYVDDIILSNTQRISKSLVKHIIYIFNKYGHEVNTNKIKYYGKGSTKRITGIYINNKKQLKAPCKHHLHVYKMKTKYEKGLALSNLESLIGKLRYINYLENRFGNLIKKYTKK